MFRRVNSGDGLLRRIRLTSPRSATIEPLKFDRLPFILVFRVDSDGQMAHRRLVFPRRRVEAENQQRVDVPHSVNARVEGGRVFDRELRLLPSPTTLAELTEEKEDSGTKNSSSDSSDLQSGNVGGKQSGSETRAECQPVLRLDPS